MNDIAEAFYTEAADCRRHAEFDERAERERPSHIYRPRLFIDGNQWCALFGENLQDGVAGFGDSPLLAYRDFDKNWREPLKSKKEMGVNSKAIFDALRPESL